MDLRLASRLTLHQQLGEGTYGQVFRATDRETGSIVAVKRLQGTLDDPIAIERFDREARTLARISHPNVVRYIAHGRDAERRACIVLEWLEGQDLAARRAHDPAPARDAITIVRGAAAGLAAAHALGIVHRDVKPSNVFLVERPEPRVALLDFGVAFLPTEPSLTMSGTAMGTTEYMPPEQRMGRDAPHPAWDVYALGMVLYELLSGKRPYTERVPPIADVLTGTPIPLRQHDPEISPALERVVMTAIAPLRRRRFADAAEFLRALDDH